MHKLKKYKKTATDCRVKTKYWLTDRLTDECGTPCTPPSIVVVGHYAQSAAVGVAGVYWQRSVGGTTWAMSRWPAELKTTCIPISTLRLQFSNTVTSRLVVLISTFYKLSYTLELLNENGVGLW